MEEARYTSPFQAALNALHLQWEVFSDIYSQNSVLESFASICRPLVASQRPHSRDTVGMQVQFEDQIDVYIGDEDGLEMSCLKVAQDVIHNWCAKPWSKKRIRQKATEPPTPERDKCSIVSQEPLSSRAVLSRDSIGSQNHQKRPRVGDVDFHDTAVFMQTHLTTPAVCKNDPHSGGDQALVDAFRQGHTHVFTAVESPESDAEMSDTGSSSADVPTANDEGTQQEAPTARQEVILYHLHDPPIHTFLNWDGFEEIMTEIAHHFAVERLQVIDAYEVVTPLPDLDANVVPIFVHMRDDFPPYHHSKLVLLDLEIHGNRVEDHFQLGPVVQRFVIVVPSRVGRHGHLRAADVDRYCTSENGRCLVFLDAKRWPDYDGSARVINNGDHARIAVPPSDGFACPTEDLVHLRQAGMTDDEIVHVMHNDEALSGYSPSLLSEADVRALAIGPDAVMTDGEEDDLSHLLQRSRESDNGKLIVGSPTCELNLPCDSFTEEFLQAMEAANRANDEGPTPIDPLSIEAQPSAFQELWIRFNHEVESSSLFLSEPFRIESWYLNHNNFHRCHSSRITLLNSDFMQWREQIAATWNDKVTSRQSLTFALVEPMPEDSATGIVGQLIVTENELNEKRSAILSVYDSDEDTARNPHTFAIVLNRRINLQRLSEVLHLQMDCPPINIRNLCSLWYGSVPIGSEHEVNVRDGNAFRLVISRGIFIDVPHLLTMENSQIRRVLQRAIHSEIYDRPSDPGFLSGNLMDFASGNASSSSGEPIDERPPWIPILEKHFRMGHTFQEIDHTPVLAVITWYVNSEQNHHCDQHRAVNLTEESFMWRTDCIFPWRDHLIRGSPADLVAFQHLLPTVAAETLYPHVIVTQGLPSESFAVIVSLQGTDGLALRRRQFAHVFPGRVSGRDILRLAVPHEHSHRPAVIQMSGQTYFPDDTLIIRTGTSILILISGVALDIYTDQIADGFSLMQRSVTQAASPFLCKPAEFALPDDFPVSLPNSQPRRPPRPYHDGAMGWSDELWNHFQTSGEWSVWDDEVTLQVATWYIHHDQRPTCHRPKHLRLTGNPITWIADLRTAWEDSLDPRLPFTILIVRPRPPQFREQRTACHVILEQAATHNKAAVILTALLEGFTQDGIIQGAFSVDNRINIAVVIRVMEIAIFCSERQCSFFHGRQLVPSLDWTDVHSGESLYVRMSPPRDEQGLNGSVDELQQHFDDLTLMQIPTTQLNPGAAEFLPGRPLITTQPEHLQDLYACSDAHAIVGEEESRALHILTWFVAPGIGTMRCMTSKRVTLFEDFLQWERRIKDEWIPLLEPDLPTSFVFVQPTPPHLEQSISAHVIIVQHEVSSWSSPLITVYDPAINQGYPFRLVTTLPERATTTDVLTSIDYARDCQTVGTTCTVWLEHTRIESGTNIAVRDGHCLTIQVSRRFLPADWCPPLQPMPHDATGLGLVQTGARLLKSARAPTEEQPSVTLPPDDTIRFDLHPAIEAFEWLDLHLFLPAYIVPDGAQLLPASRAWMDLPLWTIGCRCDEVVIYLDGAFQPCDQKAGFAVAAFIRSKDTWYQAGFISSQVIASDSYLPEVIAGLVASKFTFDLLKQIFFHQTEHCSIWLGFDSLTVGKQMTGMECLQSAKSYKCHAQPAPPCPRSVWHFAIHLACEESQGRTGK